MKHTEPKRPLREWGPRRYPHGPWSAYTPEDEPLCLRRSTDILMPATRSAHCRLVPLDDETAQSVAVGDLVLGCGTDGGWVGSTWHAGEWWVYVVVHHTTRTVTQDAGAQYTVAHLLVHRVFPTESPLQSWSPDNFLRLAEDANPVRRANARDTTHDEPVVIPVRLMPERASKAFENEYAACALWAPEGTPVTQRQLRGEIA